MQFGVFTVGDVTPDPTTGGTPTEHERIKAMIRLATKAEEIGLDVFATGEHHNPPFVPSSPTTMLGRFEHYGHGSADQAIVGLGGQVFMRPKSQDAVNEFRPYFDNAPVYGHGPSLEEFTETTPLTVGSPEQVIEKTLTFREHFGDYQRQLFLVDHAGLPLKTVLEQMDMLGEIVPVLRRELDAKRPSHVPDGPTHASLLAAARVPA